MTEYFKLRGRMKNKYKTDFQMYSNIIVSLRRKMPFFKEKIRQIISNKQHFDLIAMLKHFLLMYQEADCCPRCPISEMESQMKEKTSISF